MQVNGKWFEDKSGRKLMLRGINLGGSSKVPSMPNGATHIKQGFYHHRDVSFVGRPFAAEDADEHFTRLREWGFNFIRFLITWEAIEHTGPGIYDGEYLDYLGRILEKAGEYGFELFIDPHQDVWSRFSGGDGAPGWTLEEVGFDLQGFKESGAAITHQEYEGKLPWYTWPTNMDKLACATMFTLFFAGNDFAPHTKIDGQPVQDYLQGHYINAVKQVAELTRNMRHVVGFDSMNEPGSGFIGIKNLNKSEWPLRQGPMPTPWQSMLLGAGMSQQVDLWDRFLSLRKLGKQWLNLNKRRVWRDGFDCVWRQNGVWDYDRSGQPRLLQPRYFREVNGRKVNFANDYYIAFLKRFSKVIRSVRPEAVIFVESSPADVSLNYDLASLGNMVYAPHWYDFFTIAAKKYNPLAALDNWQKRIVFLPYFVRRSFARQLRHYLVQAKAKLGGVPVVLGEMGIPFDLDDAKAYVSGDFSQQERALDRCLQAVEHNLMNVTLWNYTADNDNIRGDQWNGEDFSIFSQDQRKDISDINSGGRALHAVIRPYPLAVAGVPLSIKFDREKLIFEFVFRHNLPETAPTEIFIPRYHYQDDYRVIVSDGDFHKDLQKQKLIYRHSVREQEHKIKILP